MCKLYNRLATALLQYEALWLNKWRATVEQARAGLKATLLVQETTTVQEGGGGTVIKVNCHSRLVGDSLVVMHINIDSRTQLHSTCMCVFVSVSVVKTEVVAYLLSHT